LQSAKSKLNAESLPRQFTYIHISPTTERLIIRHMKTANGKIWLTVSIDDACGQASIIVGQLSITL
jgi:hypothetical protein